jgi:hypothetical protein
MEFSIHAVAIARALNRHREMGSADVWNQAPDW